MTLPACHFRKHMRIPANWAANLGAIRPLCQCVIGCLLFVLSCAPAAMETTHVNTVAVWPIENASSLSGQDLDIGELFSMQIAEVIKKAGVHRVVERERLILALEELNIGSSLLVRESTRLKLGQLVGAHYMVFGAYQVFSEKMRIDLRLVDVESGKVLKAASNTSQGGDMDTWLKTVQNTAGDLH